ncbi:beta strand repeat-containing protein [Leifsonia sp. ZF2019]|uniref:beta strand repeat-containing protein n=1 Tax=Leifsonia sp. ZF2019 TaxID=2781978 RepID=UPI0021D8B7D2|nr:putative Ig domain-containing protein [Leifsonia sp. ZF2019]
MVKENVSSRPGRAAATLGLAALIAVAATGTGLVVAQAASDDSFPCSSGCTTATDWTAPATTEATFVVQAGEGAQVTGRYKIKKGHTLHIGPGEIGGNGGASQIVDNGTRVIVAGADGGDASSGAPGGSAGFGQGDTIASGIIWPGKSGFGGNDGTATSGGPGLTGGVIGDASSTYAGSGGGGGFGGGGGGGGNAPASGAGGIGGQGGVAGESGGYGGGGKNSSGSAVSYGGVGGGGVNSGGAGGDGGENTNQGKGGGDGGGGYSGGGGGGGNVLGDGSNRTLGGGGGSSFAASGVAQSQAVESHTGTPTVTMSSVVQAPIFSDDAPPSPVRRGTGVSYEFRADGIPSGNVTYGVEGDLPPGLSLDPQTGKLTGTADTVGNYTFQVTATNAVDTTVGTEHTVVVNDAPSFTGGGLGAGVVDDYYNSSLTVDSNNGGALSIQLGSGNLPPGLSLGGGSAGKATLSGTPTTAGSFTFSIDAVNSVDTTNSGDLTVVISPGKPTFTAARPEDGSLNTSYQAYQFEANSHGGGALTYATSSGSLPPGLTLSSGGKLSGTPTELGSFTFRVRVTNSAGSTDTGDLTVKIGAVAPIWQSGAPTTTATVGVPYKFELRASGEPAPTFSAYTDGGGAMPPGLQVQQEADGKWYLAGTPTTAGVYDHVAFWAINDAGSVYAPRSGWYTITVGAPPTFTADTPEDGVVDSTYSYSFAANSNNGGNVTYAVKSGSLPDGLGLTLNGTLSGTPTTAGSFQFTVTATNSAGSTDSGVITVKIVAGAPTFSAKTPSTTATVGEAYSTYSFTAVSHGGGAVSFAVGSGTLPTGLTLDSGGSLHGTPSSAGSFTFSVDATNSVGSANSGDITITVVPAPEAPTFTADAPPASGTVGVAYSYTFKADGVPSGGVSYAVKSGTLPDGLALNTSSGVLSGTPTTPGAHTFVVEATNAKGSTAGASHTITVVPAPEAPTFTADAPPASGTVGVAYSYTFKADGVPSGGVSYAVKSGTLPDGLALNTSSGVLSGTPTTPGAHTFVVEATNAKGSTAGASHTITVVPAPEAPTFTADAPPASGTVGVAYSYTFKADGVPSGGVSYAVKSGTLPDGLALNTSSGVLSGTPTTPGAHTFVVEATNAKGSTAGASHTITVVPAPEAPTFTADAPPASGTVGVAYSYTFKADGVPSGGVSYAVKSGTLPDGLALNTSSGVLSGTPTTPGAHTFVVEATNAKGSTAGASHTITVVPAPEAPTFTADAPPASGTVGVAYSYTFKADGVPSGGVSYAVKSGTLPDGLALNTSSGVLSGTPTTPGAHTFVVEATNAKGSTAGASHTITVGVPMPVVSGDDGGDPATVDGKDGIPGATITIREAPADGSRAIGDELGSNTVRSDGTWSVLLTRNPDTSTMTVTQTFDGVTSDPRDYAFDLNGPVIDPAVAAMLAIPGIFIGVGVYRRRRASA